MAAGFLVTLPTITGIHANTRIPLIAQNFLNANVNSLDGTKFTNGGGNLIAYTDATKTTRLPLEVVTFVTGGSPQVEVWVLVTASTGATIYLEASDVQISQPAFTDMYGRNAVWADHNFITHQTEVNVVDSSGNRADGVATANVVNVAGKIGRANRFNDADTSIAILGTLGITGDFTQSTWIKSADIDTGFQGILGDWGAAGSENDSYMGVTSGGDFNWDGFSTTSNKRSGVVVGEWQYWIVTKSGTTVKIYKNGIQQGADINDTKNSSTGNTHFYIGAIGDGNSHFYSGDIGKTEVSNVHTSADRALLEFQSQDDPDNWLTSSGWTEDGGGDSSHTFEQQTTYDLYTNKIKLQTSAYDLYTDHSAAFNTLFDLYSSHVKQQIALYDTYTGKVAAQSTSFDLYNDKISAQQTSFDLYASRVSVHQTSFDLYRDHSYSLATQYDLYNQRTVQMTTLFDLDGAPVTGHTYVHSTQFDLYEGRESPQSSLFDLYTDKVSIQATLFDLLNGYTTSQSTLYDVYAGRISELSTSFDLYSSNVMAQYALYSLYNEMTKELSTSYALYVSSESTPQRTTYDLYSSGIYQHTTYYDVGISVEGERVVVKRGFMLQNKRNAVAVANGRAVISVGQYL